MTFLPRVAFVRCIFMRESFVLFFLLILQVGVHALLVSLSVCLSVIFPCSLFCVFVWCV